MKKLNIVKKYLYLMHPNFGRHEGAFPVCSVPSEPALGTATGTYYFTPNLARVSFLRQHLQSEHSLWREKYLQMRFSLG